MMKARSPPSRSDSDPPSSLFGVAKDYPRSRSRRRCTRVADVIRLELKDPRVGLFTLTDVEGTPDHRCEGLFTLRNE